MFQARNTKVALGGSTGEVGCFRTVLRIRQRSPASAILAAISPDCREQLSHACIVSTSPGTCCLPGIEQTTEYMIIKQTTEYMIIKPFQSDGTGWPIKHCSKQQVVKASVSPFQSPKGCTEGLILDSICCHHHEICQANFE